MFGRRKDEGPAPSADGPRDPSLTALSVEQAQALTVLAARAFADVGLEVVPDGQGVLVGQGHRFGLHNLAAVVAQLPWREWPDAAARHAAAMGAAEADRSPVRPDQLLLKLRATDDVPNPPDFDASTRFPGVLALPAVDFPTKVQEMFAAEALIDIGGRHGWDEFREQALANLRRLPRPELMSLDADENRTDAMVHLFVSDDYFGASRVLVLDTLLADVLRRESPAHGCLVAIPNRHLLAVHLLDGLGVLAAAQVLAGVAEGECRDKPGPISDAVFYLPPTGPAESIATYADDGAVTINAADGAFGRVLTELGLIE
jgi:hypothetical protein